MSENIIVITEKASEIHIVNDAVTHYKLNAGNVSFEGSVKLVAGDNIDITSNALTNTVTIKSNVSNNDITVLNNVVNTLSDNVDLDINNLQKSIEDSKKISLAMSIALS